MTTSAAAALSGDTIAATGAASATTGTTADGATTQTTTQATNDAWYAPIQSQDVRVWAEAKGWKDPLAAVESAYNLEKLVGFDKAGRTIVLPDEKASPEQIAAFRTKMGVPEKADGYKLPVPDGFAPEFSKTAAAWFHEAGIPAKGAEQIATKWNEYLGAQAKAEIDKRTQQSEVDMNGLKTEWGQAYDQNQELARRAVAQFIPGSREERGAVLSKIEAAIGTGAMMKLFANIGQGLGEHKMHGDGDGQGLIMTPAQAQQRIAELRSNADWAKAYLGGDKEKLAEMERLQKIVAGV